MRSSDDSRSRSSDTGDDDDLQGSLILYRAYSRTKITANEECGESYLPVLLSMINYFNFNHVSHDADVVQIEIYLLRRK